MEIQSGDDIIFRSSRELKMYNINFLSLMLLFAKLWHISSILYGNITNKLHNKSRMFIDETTEKFIDRKLFD